METYKYLLTPLLTMLFVQIYKGIKTSIKEKKPFFKTFFSTGGMPSGHTAYTVSVAALVLFNEGLTSPLFAVALTFTGIVIHDSLSLRRAVGKHANAINIIAKQDTKIRRELEKENLINLKTHIGHDMKEVISGALVGIISAYVLNLLFALL